MKSIKLFFCILLLTLIVGCDTMSVKVKTEYVLVAPKNDLLVDCDKEAPPNKDVYMSATLKEREKLLTTHSLKQYENIDKCNVQLKNLRKWKVEQEMLYKNKPDS